MRTISKAKSLAESTPLLPNGRQTMTMTPENRAKIHLDVEANSPKADGRGYGKFDVHPTWKDMMRRLYPFLKPADVKHTLLALLALSAVLFGKLVNVLPPLAIKHAVDVISNGQLPTVDGGITAVASTSTVGPVIFAIVAYFCLKLLSTVTSAVQDLCQRTVAIDAERRFGVEMFYHLHHLSLSYHLEKHTGEITRIMNRGTDTVSTFINSFLFFLAPTLFETVVVSAIFWKLGTPSIALSTVGAVAVYLVFTVAVTKTRVKYRRKLIEANDAVGRKETESLVNYETVAMFGRADDEIQEYGKLRKTHKERRVDMLGMFSLLEFGQKFIRLSGVCAGLLIAGVATVRAEPPLSSGSFVAIQLYIDQLFQPLTMLGWQWRMLTQAFTDLEKAVTMLNRVPEVQDIPDAIQWNPSSSSKNSTSGEIAFENVSFHYKTSGPKRDLGGSLVQPNKEDKKGGGRGAFMGLGRGTRKIDGTNESNKENKENGVVTYGAEDNISTSPKGKAGGITGTTFRVPSGKTAALVGRSGSGKTTIVRLILRLYDSDEGIVSVGGKDVKHMTQRSLRENIGVVAQETILFNASLRNNIVYGKPAATEKEVWAAVRAAALEEFVLGLPDGLETLVGERGMKLSGGERQRVGLARCVIKDPQLILLDEATSALDSGTEREIQRNIATICKGRTTLMIAHRLSTARNADEIIVLEEGEIREQGTHDELIATGGMYAKMWKAQTGHNM